MSEFTEREIELMNAIKAIKAETERLLTEIGELEDVEVRSLKSAVSRLKTGYTDLMHAITD